MKAGIAKIDITPKLGAALNGYYRERYADHVIEPLYVTALACSDGENTVLTISLDISEILQSDTNDIRSRVSRYTGVPFEAVFVACIHTHTAPVISEIRSFFKRDEEYYQEFCDKICRASAEAIADMKEATVSIGRGKAEGVSFVRRFRKKDGTARFGSKAMIGLICGIFGIVIGALVFLLTLVTAIIESSTVAFYLPRLF